MVHPSRQEHGIRPRLRLVLAVGLATTLTLLLAATTPTPAPAGTLPDLDQGAPAKLDVTKVDGRAHLGFESTVKNVGTGNLLITGQRATPDVDMAAAQSVDGTSRPLTATLNYQATPDGVKGHNHWHFRGFTVFELRRWTRRGRGARAPVATSRKQGFCLSSMSVRNCSKRRPELLETQMGLLRGAVDTYSADVEGQFIDVTRVRTGTYVLSHTSDPTNTIAESSEANNSASVRILVIRRRGRVHVSTLKSCPRTRRC